MSVSLPLGPFYGALFFATILSTALYGITCAQIFFYYTHYQKDLIPMKIFVAVLWTFDTIHEALIISGVYKYIMSGLVNQFSVLGGNPDIFMQSILTSVVAIFSQGFLVYRIYMFTGKKVLVPMIWAILAIAELVATIAYTGIALQQGSNFGALNDSSSWIIFSISLSVTAGVDVIIAACMTFLLARERKVLTSRSTAHTLGRLIVFSVSTGIWTATFAILTLILPYISPSNLLFSIPGISICAVYCNAVLANLNARTYLRGEDTVDATSDWFTESRS